VSTEAQDNRDEHLKLSVEELLRRGHPLPPHDEMAIEDLSEAERAWPSWRPSSRELDSVARLACRGEPGLVREFGS
jgi:hypothetical protein